MAELLGTKGAELDLLIRQGATAGVYSMYVKKADGTPLDLTGATFSAQIRKTPDSAPLAGVAFVFTIEDAVAGAVLWSIPAESTALIPCSEIDENQPESQYVWDMELERADGSIMPLLYGVVKVFREITRSA